MSQQLLLEVCPCDPVSAPGTSMVRWGYTLPTRLPPGVSACTWVHTSAHKHGHGGSPLSSHISRQWAFGCGHGIPQHDRVWSGLFLRGDITAHKEMCCVCKRSCVRVYSVSVSIPTLFTHVNTQKPHGKPLRAAAAVEYVIQMACDCRGACVCLCRSINTCMCACVIISACKNKRHWCVSAGSLWRITYLSGFTVALQRVTQWFYVGSRRGRNIK